jgi:hypothetical protein
MSWDPEPAELRDGERPDVSAHAAANIEQVRRAAEDGVIGEERAREAIERIAGRD